MDEDDAVGDQTFMVRHPSGRFDLLHIRGEDRDVLRIHQRKAVRRFWLIQMTGGMYLFPIIGIMIPMKPITTTRHKIQAQHV